MAKSNQQPKKDKISEFGLIAEHFAPLAKSPGALGLLDDGAILSIAENEDLITTTDMLVSGVHFLPQAEPEEIVTKLLAVNVSDLAAMGAKPMGYLLVTAFTEAQDNAWLSRFSKRLERDQTRYGMTLYGGDTVATPGPLCLSLTAFGTVPHGQALKRSNALLGDAIYVSGTIGDSALGLLALRDILPEADAIDQRALIERFQNPQPRFELGQALRGVAHGVADISDGLIADLGHICGASHMGATINADEIPLSNAVQNVLKRDLSHLTSVLSGGDDYELVFTVPCESQEKVERIAKEIDLKVTQIGKITDGSGVKITNSKGGIISLELKGYRHF